MPTSIIQARYDELQALRNQKKDLAAMREDVKGKMREMRDFINDDTQQNLKSSSESARGNRKVHRERATLDMDQELMVQEELLQSVENQIEEIDKEIEAL